MSQSAPNPTSSGSAKHSWNRENLKSLPTDKLKNVLFNAQKKGVIELIKMCEAELATRSSPKSKGSEQAKKEYSGDEVVVGYHFVCGNSNGVFPVGDGCFRSGSWRVSEQVVKESLKHGAYLALHESKAEPSYRQGEIIGYERAPRDMVNRDNEGIEFLVRETEPRLSWIGAGSGEKGYNRRKRSEITSGS